MHSLSTPPQPPETGTTPESVNKKLWGAELRETGVLYHVPKEGDTPPSVQISGSDGEERVLRMVQGHECAWTAWDAEGKSGDRHLIELPDGQVVPDPGSRAQPEGVHGPSQVVDATQFPWTDQHWRRPAFRDIVIYEIHIGTFTPEGTFRAAMEKLPYLKELSINAIEIMPVASFPGQRNWGYDGVFSFAPAAAYGTPDDLKALINAAHAMGIAVIMDVVYNHFGPDGNYTTAVYPAFVSSRHQTPWGEGINFDGKGASPVRSFVMENVHYWLEEFHADGLRLDATHAIMDDSQRHILAEAASVIREHGCYAIAEESRNLSTFTENPRIGGYGFHAVWADDFHHVARISQTHDGAGYYQDYRGSLDEFSETLEHGWLYRGQYSPFLKRPRGTPCEHLPPSAFIHFISNHDHAGNHALGKRLNHLISPEAYRALSLFMCLTPYTPMLFMGQEWATEAPFQFFTDHHPELGERVKEGRREEFAGCPGYENEEDLRKIPDPQDEQTFLKSKLPWQELKQARCASVLALYKEALALRFAHRCFRPQDREGWSVHRLNMGCAAVLFEEAAGRFALIISLWGSKGGSLAGETPLSASTQNGWALELSSEDTRFGGSGSAVFDAPSQTLAFSGPACVLLRSNQPA